MKSSVLLGLIAALGLEVADQALKVVRARAWVVDFSVLVDWSSRGAHKVTLELFSLLVVLSRSRSLDLWYFHPFTHRETRRFRFQYLYAVIVIGRGAWQSATLRNRVLGVPPFTYSGLVLLRSWRLAASSRTNYCAANLRQHI